MEDLLWLGSIPLAILPALLYLAALWWLDRYDREPVFLLGLAFLWGAAGAVPLVLVIGAKSLSLLSALEPSQLLLFNTVVLAPLLEEPAKGLALLVLVRNRHFDNVTDGFVYGAAIGLGFGMSENLVYFQDSAREGAGVWLWTVALRTAYSSLLHASASAILGAATALAMRQGAAKKSLCLAAGLCASIAMHALWNVLSYLGAEVGLGYGLLNFALFPLEFLSLFLLFQLCLLRERTVLLVELQEEVEAGILPASHLPQFCLAVGRRPKELLEPEIDRRRYLRLGTKLAFTKDQAKRSKDPSDLQRQITQLRTEIDTLLCDAGIERVASVRRRGPQTNPTEPRPEAVETPPKSEQSS